MDVPLQGEDQRHGMLGHGGGVDAGRIGEADAVLAKQLLVVLVDAGADRLDELEPLGPPGTKSFFHMIDGTTTSASPMRAANSSGFQTWKWAMPVPRAAKRAAIW